MPDFPQNVDLSLDSREVGFALDSGLLKDFDGYALLCWSMDASEDFTKRPFAYRLLLDYLSSFTDLVVVKRIH